MTEVTHPPGEGASARRLRLPLAQLAPLPVLLLAWHVAAAADLASDRVLPTPAEVGQALVELLQRTYFYENLWATLRVIGIGLTIAVVAGLSLAVIIGLVPVLRDGVYPFVVALNIVPKVALVPLITISMGFSQTSRIVVVVMVAFFPVFVNTLTAIRDADRQRDQLMLSLGATRVQRLRMHRFPEGAPVIFAGVKLALTIAFIAAILAEFLIQRDGLAYLITVFRGTLNTPMMYAVTIVVATIGLAFYGTLAVIERRVAFWDAGSSGGS